MEKIADFITVIDNGSILFSDEKDNLLISPANLALLHPVPFAGNISVIIIHLIFDFSGLL